jgi:tRNA A-37 threonylcarbamoyl transferase component Bud32
MEEPMETASPLSNLEAPLPARIGPYRVIRLARRGGMSLLYEGENEAIGRRVALKVLRPSLRGGPAEKRLRGEAWVANRVRHPGLVSVHELGALPCGTPYLVMDYLEGAPLSDLLRQGRPGRPEEALDGLALLRQVAGALCALHRQGIVHRDIKPGNIMIVPDPEQQGGRRALVLDFGLARWPGAPEEPGLVMGTPAYMAPEQWRDPGKLDGRADVYALGVVLYEVLAGERPFLAEDPNGLMRQHLNEAPRPLPGVPAPLSVLVAAMLEKDAGRRPSMAQVVEALAQGDRTVIDIAPAQVMARDSEARDGGGWGPAWLLVPALAALGSLVVLLSAPGDAGGRGQAVPSAPVPVVEALRPAQAPWPQAAPAQERRRPRMKARRQSRAPARQQAAPLRVPAPEAQQPDDEQAQVAQQAEEEAGQQEDP